MGRGVQPTFDSIVDLQKLRDELGERNLTSIDVAKILHRASSGNVRGILNGDVAMRVTDLTQLLGATGIKLSEIVNKDYEGLL